MAKIRRYVISEAGGKTFAWTWSTCLSKAAKKFIATLPEPASYELYGGTASVRYCNNHEVICNFVIQEISRDTPLRGLTEISIETKGED